MIRYGLIAARSERSINVFLKRCGCDNETLLYPCSSNTLPRLMTYKSEPQPEYEYEYESVADYRRIKKSFTF